MGFRASLAALFVAIRCITRACGGLWNPFFYNRAIEVMKSKRRIYRKPDMRISKCYQ